MALKQEDFEKLSEYLDLQDVETFDDAKNKFDEVYARKDTYQQSLLKDQTFLNTVIGKTLGKHENSLKSFAKEAFGIEFDKDDFKGGSDYESVSKVVFDKVKQKHIDSVKEMESKIGADPSELVKEWEGKLEKEKNAAKKWKTEFETLGQNFETFKTELQSNMRKEKLNKHVSDLFASIDYPEEVKKDELRISGFKTKILSDVEFDLDETDKFVLLGKDKMPITNPSKAGATYSPEEFLREQAIKYDLLKINPAGGQRVTAPVYQKQVVQDEPPSARPAPRIHPSAVQAAQG